MLHLADNTISLETNPHRRIFGTLPKNMDEEDMVDPVVSTLDILKAQWAHKAAEAWAQAEERSQLSESETKPETQSMAQSQSPLAPHTMSPILNTVWPSESTLPLASSSAAGPQHQASSRPSDSPQGHPSQASQQLRAHHHDQTQSS